MTQYLPNNIEFAADELAGKTILISGAGDGIGRVAAKTYAAHGATVLLLGRTTAKLEAVYDEIVTAGHPEPAILPLDLNGASENDYNELAAAIENEYGKLDGLLHNASLLGRRSPLASYPTDTFTKVMNVNVNAAFMLSKACTALLDVPATASIIFTSSSVGRKGRAHWGAYAISKFATEGMMEVMADELEGISNIRVNTLNPGATRTNMRAQAYPAENPNTLKTAEELMPLYLYLMSDQSRNLSGEKFNAQ